MLKFLKRKRKPQFRIVEEPRLVLPDRKFILQKYKSLGGEFYGHFYYADIAEEVFDPQVDGSREAALKRIESTFEKFCINAAPSSVIKESCT